MLIIRRRPGEGFWVVDSDSGRIARVHVDSVGSGRSRAGLAEQPVKLLITGSQRLRFLRDDVLKPEDIVAFQKRMEQQIAEDEAKQSSGVTTGN